MVLPLAGSTFRVTGGLPLMPLVEVIHQAPPSPMVMPLPCMASVCTVRRILPSSDSSKTLLGSTWSKISKVPVGVNCIALGSLMVGLLLNSLLTFLEISGAAFISATFASGIFTPWVGLVISKLGSLSAHAGPVTARDRKSVV